MIFISLVSIVISLYAINLNHKSKKVLDEIDWVRGSEQKIQSSEKTQETDA